jgi:hypothetical protein
MLIDVRDDTNAVRWSMEPAFLRRWRRIKAIWNAFKFLARGGKFKVFLDFTGIDPRILKPVKITIAHDGRVVDLERERHNAVAGAMGRMTRLAGLTLAKDDEPGFRVRWTDTAQKIAWKDSGFDVSAAPDRLFITQDSKV